MGTAGFGGSFAPIVQYEKWEIHKVFPHFPYFRLGQNISPNLLVPLCGVAQKCHCTQKHIRAMTFLLCCFQIRILVFSQSSRSRYRVNTMLDRVQVSGYAQEIVPNWGMNFRVTVT